MLKLQLYIGTVPQLPAEHLCRALDAAATSCTPLFMCYSNLTQSLKVIRQMLLPVLLHDLQLPLCEIIRHPQDFN